MKKIRNRKDLSFFLQEDYKHMGGVNYTWPLRWLVGEEHARMILYIWVLRHLEYYTNVRIPVIGYVLKLFFEIWHRRQQLKYGVYIGKNICGYGLRIVHTGGIHVNANDVGNYFSITQGCVLGNNHYKDERPFIGDNVKLTLGAKVIGGVHIGNNSIICPNSVVIKDVPDNSIASGVPITIIKQRK